MALRNVNYKCGHSRKENIEKRAGRSITEIIEYRERGECYTCEKYHAACREPGDEVEMHYSAYKNNYYDCATKPDSYNADTKTIIVRIPADRADKIAAKAMEKELHEIMDPADWGVYVSIMLHDPQKFKAAVQTLEDRGLTTDEVRDAHARGVKCLEVLKKYGRLAKEG